MFLESINTVDKRRGIFAGTIVMYVTSFSFIVQIIYNSAIGIANVDLMYNAVVILYLNDIDEHIFDSIKRLNPKWVDERENEILLSVGCNDDDGESHVNLEREVIAIKNEINQMSIKEKNFRS